METADDAAVYRVGDQAIVETVDFFSPIVDDPADFGRIAAANALSDVYAMGARPLFALNIVAWPVKDLPLSVLNEVLRGGAEKAAEAGIAILGGHSVDDRQPKYGLVVTGVVDPSRILRNRGARPGDRLVLTKPLGTGIVANAAKAKVASAASVAASVGSMSALNRAASEAAIEVGVNACTDVTGFGLAGHLLAMLSASGVAARVRADELPLFPGVRELAGQGHVPGGSKRNLDFYRPRMDSDGVDPVTLAILADAQTSGGLLLSVPADRAAALSDALRRRGVPGHFIGEIVDGPGRMAVVPF